MKHAAWAYVADGWRMVGDETVLAEAQLIRDALREQGIDAEVRAVPKKASGR